MNPSDAGGDLPEFDASKIEWREPWQAVTSEYALVAETELKRELSPKHILFGRPVRAIGRRGDADTILFRLGDTVPQFAVVHLTFRKEIWSDYPVTRLFGTLDDWIRRCLVPDAKRYSS